MKKILFIVCLLHIGVLRAQTKPDRELKMNLNDSGTHYMKATFTGQIWARYNESNPGTTVGGFEKSNTFDIGLRRVRAQFFGKVHDKVFVYTQVGINNVSYNTPRRSPIYFHDVLAEYYITPKSLQMGMGLTAWTGFSRFASPAVATIMGYDAPLFAQATNDATDQFLRKFSVYAKGKLGKFDYRIIASTPMEARNSTVIKTISTNSDFSFRPAKLQTGGYLMYQFFDQESNLTPYMTGTYLGKKKVFNIGIGAQYQPDAMWHWNNTTQKDTVTEAMFHYAADLFYDRPVGDKGAAISFYATWMHMGFGKNYVRNLGAMNPGDSIAAGKSSFNGTGSAYPMIGTGSIAYAQLGFLLPKNALGEKCGQLMPYVMITHSNFDRLKQPLNTFDAGVNYFIDGHKAKLSLNYQNRPVVNATTLKEYTRKNMIVLQFQVAI
ncbi:MAG: hypothetical protein K1X81_06620 [Bacteroidia bacterium]|nr:hypothetical protein [Bacteroidia bacterium]